MSFQILFGKSKQLRRIEKKLDQLLTLGAEIMAHIDELRAEVEENRSVIGSAIVLIEGLAARLDEIADDPAQVRALAVELRGGTDELAAAVQAHTPADPDEPEEPEEPIE